MSASDLSEAVRAPKIPQQKSATQVERASDRELVIRRFFRASPRTVFDAMTRAEHLRRWWAPRSLGVVLIDCQADVRVGGRYRYVFGRPGEPEMAFSGVYQEVVPGARVVYTQLFEPMPHTGDGVITATYEAKDGGTLLTQRELYPSKEVLDGAIASGMERGMRETLEQLDQLLPELEGATKNRTEVERKSELDLVVRRTVNAPARLVFEAWTKADLFRRWWVPESYNLTLLSCDMDVRVGGQYRLVFRHQDSTMEFFGTYLEVTPHSRLVWTNDEGDQGKTVTTVTFEEHAGKTSLVVHDRYPTKAALESGATGAMPEVLDQLDELLAGLV